MLKYAFKNAFEKERCQVSYGNLIRWYKSSMILSTKWMPLQVNICQKHLFLNQLSTIWRQIVHWITSSAHENSKLRTCWEDYVYINCSECQTKNKKQFVYTTSSELAIFMCWTRNSMNNLSSYCGLVDAKIRTSDKYLPAP